MNKEQILGLSLVLGILFVFYVAPLIWVLASNRSQGGTKFGWLIVVFLFSWLGLAVFLIVTKVPNSGVAPSTGSSGSLRVEPTIRDMRKW